MCVVCVRVLCVCVVCVVCETTSTIVLINRLYAEDANLRPRSSGRTACTPRQLFSGRKRVIVTFSVCYQRIPKYTQRTTMYAPTHNTQRTATLYALPCSYLHKYQWRIQDFSEGDA